MGYYVIHLCMYVYIYIFIYLFNHLDMALSDRVGYRDTGMPPSLTSRNGDDTDITSKSHDSFPTIVETIIWTHQPPAILYIFFFDG